jgi:hypothetical protein
MPSRLAVVAAIVAAFTAARAQVANAPCFEPNLGTPVGSGHNLVFPAVALGFPFNYAGAAYTQIEISTNGFVWLGANNNTNARCCAGRRGAFLFDPPSIAAFWTNLVTTGGNSAIFFNALPGRAVVTWRDAVEYGGSTWPFTIQLQLTALGEVTFWYSPDTIAIQVSHRVVVGITPGSGAIDPGATDLSAALPVNTVAEPTIYEEWAGNAFDLRARSFELIPNGMNGFVAMNRPACAFTRGSFAAFGVGCPPAAPLVLQQDGGNPVVGATWRLRVANQAPTSAATILVFGFNQILAGLPLDNIGMTGCRQYVSLDAQALFATAFPYTVCTLRVPVNPALVGSSIHAQAANVAPGVNPLGIEASNGGTIRFGAY